MDRGRENTLGRLGALICAAAAALATLFVLSLGRSAGEAPVLADAPSELAADAGHEVVALPLPEWLSQTGLYLQGSTSELDPRVLSFAPQYPLWTDGATKRRFVLLPDGALIDGSDPDAWELPPGTRLWKEFSFGRRVETRYMEKLADGSFRYATYLWSEDGRDARRVMGDKSALVPLGDASLHEVPSESDCRACHEAKKTPVLGFTALQLSSDRDPNAPHRELAREGDVDLTSLVERGLLTGLPKEHLTKPPRIAARTPRERAALGYLYGNCSSCHNADGPIASVGLDFDQRLGGRVGHRVFETAVDHPSRFVIPGASESVRIAPSAPDESVVVHRMASRFAATQMPPLGTRAVDEEALELMRSWIEHDLLSERNELNRRTSRNEENKKRGEER